jgi:hypothetical protein
MRSPSGKVLANRCDIFAANRGVDNDGGVKFTYNAGPTYGAMPCSVQYTDKEEVVEMGGLQRITTYREYMIILGVFVTVNPRDMILWTDQTGRIVTMFVQAAGDEAGRGSTMTIRAVERQ